MTEAPRFEPSTSAATAARADLLVLPMFQGPLLGPDGEEVGHALDINLLDTLRRNGIRGKRGETFALEGLGLLGSKRVLLIGADRDDEVAAIRETGMRAGSAARPHRIVATTVVTLGADASWSRRGTGCDVRA